MGTQAPTNSQIERTTDYSKFKFMGGNREVDYNHVKRLKREMEYNPTLLEAAPILVNESLYVVDGQHRLKAAEELRLPVYYMVKPGLTIEAARHMNVTQKRWQLMDFAKSFAQGGNMDYINFIRVNTEYADIAPNIIMKVLLGGDRHESGADFRRGNFKIEDLDAAKENLEKLNKIAQKAKITLNAPMATAILKLLKGTNKADEFDVEKLLKKLDHDGAKQVFVPSGSVRGCLRSIEDAYNFMSNSRVRLY